MTDLYQNPFIQTIMANKNPGSLDDDATKVDQDIETDIDGQEDTAVDSADLIDDKDNADNSNQNNNDDSNSSDDNSDGSEDLEDADEEITDPLYVAINELYSTGDFYGIPDDLKDISSADFTAEHYKKMLLFNMEKAVEENQTRLLEPLSDVTKALLNYELNNGADTDSFLKELVFKTDIKNLDPTNELDQVTIVREFYKNSMAPEDLNELISSFQESGQLSKQAKILKPKLDEKADEIVMKKINDQKLIEQTEENRKKDLQNRTLKLFEKGKLGNIPITKEQATTLYHAIANEEVPVTIKGKKVMLPYSEALGFYNKFNDKGDLERYATSLMLLLFPEDFNKYYSIEAKNTEISKQRTQNLISQKRKSGAIIEEKNTNTPNKTKQKFLFTPKRVG